MMVNKIFDGPERYAVLFILVVASFIMLPGIASYPLLGQWEPHYGEVMREMVWGKGNFLTPIYKGHHFWSKPVGIFWILYPFYKLLASPESTANYELASRLPIALFAIAGVMYMY